MKQKIKFIEIYNGLTPEERKKLKKHINQTFLTSSDMVKLFNTIYSAKKISDTSKLLSDIHSKYFENLSSKRFTNLLAQLKSTLDDWLICYELLNSKYDKSLALLEAYNNRGIYDEANRVAQKLESNIRNNKLLDLRKNYSYYRLKHLQYYSDNPIKYGANKYLIKEVVDSFNQSHKSTLLLYNAELFNWGRIQQLDFDELIQSNINISSFIPDEKLSLFTKNLEHLMQNFDEESLYKVSRILFDDQLQRDTILHTLSCEYCIYTTIQLMRKNQLKDHDLLLKLYEYGLESKALLKEGKVSPLRFFNIIGALCLSNNYDTMNQFANKWIDKVQTQNPATILSISKAQICLHCEKYQEIRNLLRGLKFEDRLQKYRVMRYELAALYEEGEIDLLNTTIQNFSRSLLRNRSDINKRNLAINRNLLKVLKYLMKGEFEAVKHVLNSGAPIVFRDWISKKINGKG